jgi:hypothetical protein
MPTAMKFYQTPFMAAGQHIARVIATIARALARIAQFAAALLVDFGASNAHEKLVRC